MSQFYGDWYLVAADGTATKAQLRRGLFQCLERIKNYEQTEPLINALKDLIRETVATDSAYERASYD